MQIVARPRPGFTSSHLSKLIFGLGRYTILYTIWYTRLYMYIKAPCSFWIEWIIGDSWGFHRSKERIRHKSHSTEAQNELTADEVVPSPGTVIETWSTFYFHLFPEIDNWTLSEKLFIAYLINTHSGVKLSNTSKYSEQLRFWWVKGALKSPGGFMSRIFGMATTCLLVIGDGRNRKKRFVCSGRIW